MSKIGDELREFADVEALNPIQISTLKHLADRIRKLAAKEDER